MYKGVIFDLDGTILDTIEDLGNCVNQVLEMHGFKTHSICDYKQKVGHGFKDLITVSSPKGTSEELIELMLNEFKEIYSYRYMECTKPYDGIPDLLRTLLDNNIKIAVNSNKGDYYCKELVKNKFIGIQFIDCIGERINCPKKPDPSAVYEILEKMQLNTADVVFVGDSAVDIKTAKNANIDSIFVSWGFKRIKDIIEYKPTTMVDTVEQLKNKILD